MSPQLERLEALYGVAHGGQVTNFNGEQKEFFVEPSEALKHELNKLALGSRMGV